LQLDKPKFDAANLQIVAISKDDAALSKQVRQQGKLTFPLLCDPVESHKVGDAYQVFDAGDGFHLPAVFLIDKSGKIQLGKVGVAHGPFDATVYDAALQMVKDKKLS